MPLRPTTCALCESRCGLLAEVDRGRVVKLRPDPDHPVSRGHACAKGLRFHQVHTDPRRVIRPRLRRDGAWTDVPWPEALAHLGGRLRAIVDAHGPDAVGIYSGNAAGHSLGAVLGVAALQRALGTRRHYSCLTLDNAPQFVVYEAVCGAALRTFAADFARADAIALFGTDPLSSQCSQAQSNPRGPHHLRAAGRAGRLWVVDPRRSLTAKAGRHLPVRPGGDLAILSWLLREALAARPAPGGVRPGDAAALAAAVARFDLDGAAAAADLPAAELTALRDALLAAERPIVWSGLGVLLGGHGTLGFWLTLCLQAVLGGVGVPGGWCVPPAPVDLGRVGQRLGLRARDPSRRGRSGHPAILDTLPAADLAADAAAGDLRALVVLGGNPALALPDHARARDALAGLDLLVSIDLFANDTAALAHAILPARTFLERDDLPLHLAGQRWADGAPVPIVREQAVVDPPADTRGDLAICCDLARAAGRAPFGSRAADLALRLGVDPLTAAHTVARVLGGTAAPPVSLHPDGALHLAEPAFLEALAAWAPPTAPLTLITSVRPIETLNHWIHRYGARPPMARAHPDTIAAVGAGPVTVRTDTGALTVALTPDPDVRPGVIALPYGWGHLPGAVATGGVCANTLVSATELEAFTGQPRSNGAAVTVDR